MTYRWVRVTQARNFPNFSPKLGNKWANPGQMSYIYRTLGKWFFPGLMTYTYPIQKEILMNIFPRYPITFFLYFWFYFPTVSFYTLIDKS